MEAALRKQNVLKAVLGKSMEAETAASIIFPLVELATFLTDNSWAECEHLFHGGKKDELKTKLKIKTRGK